MGERKAMLKEQSEKERVLEGNDQGFRCSKEVT